MRQARPEVRFGQMALIALGSNAASREISPADLVLSGIAALSDKLGPDLNRSRLFASPAFPAGSGPDYVNAVIRVATDLPPDRIMAALHQIEADHGRVRGARWASRTLDLDLLAVDDAVLPDAAVQTSWRTLNLAAQRTRTPDQLILPHPRLQERAFVLVPMMDVAPDWRHPLLDLTVAAMLAELPEDDRAAIVPID